MRVSPLDGPWCDRQPPPNPQQTLEAYGIKGVVLAGMIPDAERKRSFELYRNSLSGLSIITFDELLAKLKSLREFLSAKLA